MAAILPGYEYDIFISYRQNDNKPATAGKRDGWVTNFVTALKDELEATLKNPVSIYFDENPHDGLLETHQVDASLAKKLKCIVLIPIISQTFCDTSSFAWEHEFLVFNKMAKADELGMNVTLPNGNVASRVLPVKIHDLDDNDLKLLDTELGGPMRSIDFIYREPGVNRPLKPSDERNLNLEKTDYHNQINKVANALKEIGNALVSPPASGDTTGRSKPENSKPAPKSASKKSKRNPKLVTFFVLVPLIFALIYFSITLFKGPKKEKDSSNRSIAVLPFRNDSNDPGNIYFCNGLMEDIINQLAQIPNMRVPSATSMLYYRDNPKPYDEIIEELDVAYLLEASVRKMDGKAIMNITLINAEQNEQIWSERMEMDLSVNDLFDVQFEVANAVANKMRIAMDNTKGDIPTSNYQAYDNFTKARDLMKIWDKEKNRTAIDLLQEATKLDSEFLDAYVFLGQAYGQRAELSDGGNWVDSTQYYSTIAFDMNSQDAGATNAMAYANVLGGNPLKGLELYLKAIDINPNTPYNYAGWCYWQLGEFDKAALWAVKTIKQDPKNSIYYIDMTNACNALGLFDYTMAYSLKALEINSTHTFAADSQKEMAFLAGNYTKAVDYSHRAFKISGVLKFEAFEGVYYYKLDSIEKAYTLLNNNFRESFNEKTDDENSKFELYELMQYQALVNLKFKDEEKGKKQLEDLANAIEKYVTNSRPEKYYLLAGCHATLGNTEKSLEYLNKVFEMGYFNYYTINSSSLLEPLYGNEEYERIISKIKVENDKMQDKVLASGLLVK